MLGVVKSVRQVLPILISHFVHNIVNLRRGNAEREAVAFARRAASEDAEFTAFERDVSAYDAGDAIALPPNVTSVICIENRYDASFPHDAVQLICMAMRTARG